MPENNSHSVHFPVVLLLVCVVHFPCLQKHRGLGISIFILFNSDTLIMCPYCVKHKEQFFYSRVLMHVTQIPERLSCNYPKGFMISQTTRATLCVCLSSLYILFFVKEQKFNFLRALKSLKFRDILTEEIHQPEALSLQIY